jgi:uncharacterized repeat protein (TIGR01451 family)
MEDFFNGFPADPRVWFDRLTDRWITISAEFNGDPGVNGNRILLAVSDGPVITASTVWAYFYFDQDQASPVGDFGCEADFPTLGVDAQALYIGAAMWCGAGAGSWVNNTAFVVRKASLLNPATPSDLTATPGAVTAFRELLGPSGGLFTPQGVNNYDPAANKGYYVSVDVASFDTLVVREVFNPGSGAPTLGDDQFLPVAATDFPVDVPVPGGGLALDGGDDSLLSAHLRNGRIWTSHQVAVNASGVADGTGDRNATRWYELDVTGPAPSAVQIGTVFDPGATPRSYWMSSIMVSGQGHAALGFTAASAGMSPAAATVGRLAGDPLGTTAGTPEVYHPAEAAYVASTPTETRWGDYSMTSLDPCDDMTLWTIQEFAATPVPGVNPNWGTRVVRLLAPPPATPVSASPAVVPLGRTSIQVTVQASTPAGAAFYDTPSTGMSSCRTRLTAAVGQGVTVNSVRLVDADTVILDINTTAAAPGAAGVTVTNPDGQSRVGTVLTLAPVSASKAVTGSFREGGAITYTIVLTNRASFPSTDKAGDELTDTLPAAVTPVGPPTATIGTAALTGNTLTWNGALLAGQSTTITVNAVINAGAEGQILTNQAQVQQDLEGNGTNDVVLGSDDPAAAGAVDPTIFQVVWGPADFFTVSPCRVVDTRNPPGPLGGPALPAQETRTFTVAGTCGIPSTAKAVSLNVAVTQASALGNLRIYPAGTHVPLVSTVNYRAGQTRSNNAVVAMNASGELAAFNGQASGTTHVILDVNGYFE